jgi:hypothetical protein
MRVLRVLVAFVLALSVVPVVAQTTWDNPLPDPVPYPVDSGSLTNHGRDSQVVYEETVQIEDAKWMRLYFGEVQLGAGSILRITSLFDGEVQELDAAGLAMWSDTSAYFNGNELTVEVVAGPQTENRLVIDMVAWEEGIPTLGCDPGCCGPTDDRVSSDEDWAGRLLPAGCTASVYNTDSCAVSAGHCVSGGMLIEFKVPLNNPNCSSAHPPVSEQFPVTAFLFTNGGIANDWSAMTVGTNNLGQTPFDRYGDFRPLASTPPEPGQPAAVWGYGTDDQCLLAGTQQTSDGFIEVVEATGLRYSIDVTFGNSGSGVLRDGQENIGIVTHCCCPNWGTRMDHPSFVAARETLCPTSPPQAAGLISATVVIGTQVSGSLPELQATDGQYLEVDSVTQGSRNSTLTIVEAQSPFSTVNELNVNVVYGPADANPVFLAVALMNYDTGLWDTLQFGILNQGSATVVELDAVPSPNQYVNGSGQIQVRVAATAREPQTPGGFTKLIDSVSVSVQP